MFIEKSCIFVIIKGTLKNNTTMATAVKKTTASPKKTKVNTTVDARSRIKPRGLRGMFKGRIILNGTDEEVFSLNRLADVK